MRIVKKKKKGIVCNIIVTVECEARWLRRVKEEKNKFRLGEKELSVDLYHYSKIYLIILFIYCDIYYNKHESLLRAHGSCRKRVALI